MEKEITAGKVIKALKRVPKDTPVRIELGEIVEPFVNVVGDRYLQEIAYYEGKNFVSFRVFASEEDNNNDGN